MRFSGLLTNHEYIGDLAVAPTLYNQMDHFPFPISELWSVPLFVAARLSRDLVHQFAHHLWMQARLAMMSCPNGIYKSIGRNIL